MTVLRRDGIAAPGSATAHEFLGSPVLAGATTSGRGAGAYRTTEHREDNR